MPRRRCYCRAVLLRRPNFNRAMIARQELKLNKSKYEFNISKVFFNAKCKKPRWFEKCLFNNG